MPSSIDNTPLEHVASSTPAPIPVPAAPDAKLMNITVNGVDMQVKAGTTIIEAMKSHQQEIAHYCWHPALSIAGVCRMCMVEIEGNPRLQIACNTTVTEGMKVNNTSAKVEDAVKWGLDFHLINHPLDCPICDQAGECGLQDQYMQYGKYDPEMTEHKVKKHKAVDLGPTVVLDSERCILCARCVRFTDEVTKTNELGIFNRGDHSEIGTFDGKPLNNNYSLNTVDICPVGALTSKDFRFRQRVWLLKTHDTICTGCSTGCNIKVYFNKDGLFREKPNVNPEVNGYWMCDEGRGTYKFVNRSARLLDGRWNLGGKAEWVHPVTAAKKAGEILKAAGTSAALVLTGQHSVEEYEAMVSYMKEIGSTKIYHWINNPEKLEEFDGLLLRGDKNPNTRGLREVLERHAVKTEYKDLATQIASGAVTTIVVAGPENRAVYPDFNEKVAELSKVKQLIWLTAGKSEALENVNGDTILVPLKTYVEKGGTFVNFKGIRQSVTQGLTVVPNALSLEEAAAAFAGREVKPQQATAKVGFGRIYNEATKRRGEL